MFDHIVEGRRGSLRDAVLPELRRAILSGRLPAGSRLRESEIARNLGVSRSPVREAIAKLEQDGLAERFPNRGAFVADVYSRRAIAELAGLRNVLECFALQLVASRTPQPDWQALRAVTMEMDAAAARQDFAAVADTDVRFHRGLVELARHRKLLQVWSGVAEQYWALYLPAVQEMGRNVERWGDNHRRILDALADRRLDLALMYLQYNILDSAEALRQRLPEDGAQDAETVRGFSALTDGADGPAGADHANAPLSTIGADASSRPPGLAFKQRIEMVP
jgi:DNA-binding GntR family transcriptional regulator